jgi:hypothetical protein
MTAAGKPVALLVATLLLAGCSEEPQPRFEDPTPSPSETSSSSAPPEREPWQVKSRAGAEAFAEHWIETFNEAQATGDTAMLRASSVASCKTCNGYAKQIERLYGAGGRLRSDGWTVLLAAAGPGQVTDEAQVNLRVSRSPQRVIAGNGQVRRFPGGRATFSAELEWRDGQWQMARLVQFV